MINSNNDYVSVIPLAYKSVLLYSLVNTDIKRLKYLRNIFLCKRIFNNILIDLLSPPGYFLRKLLGRLHITVIQLA